MSVLSCILCFKELKTILQDGEDRHRLLSPWVTKCGHVFHRKCLLQWIVTKQRMGGNTLQTADPNFEVLCPTRGCSSFFTLSTAMAIFPAFLMPRTFTPPTANQTEGSAQAQNSSNTEESDVEKLKKEIQNLRDANTSLGILEVHRLLELENYRVNLEEFRKELQVIVGKIDQLLSGIDTSSYISVLGASTSSPTAASADQPQENASASSTANSDHEASTAIPVPEPIFVTPMEEFQDASTGRLSATPSSVTNRSYYSANSEQSTCTNRSRHSAESAPSTLNGTIRDQERRGERDSDWRQSHPNLGESGNRRKPRNSLIRLITALVNPGNLRRQTNVPASDI